MLVYMHTQIKLSAENAFSFSFVKMFYDGGERTFTIKNTMFYE